MRACDLPGLGPVPSHPDVQSYDDLARYVARAVAAPTVLVGQSMGGYVALKLALARPELARRLEPDLPRALAAFFRGVVPSPLRAERCSRTAARSSSPGT
jgi:pimeloyl-ACP methyl ester carboxylesterase